MNDSNNMTKFFGKQLADINRDFTIVQMGLESYSGGTEVDPHILTHALEMILRQYESLEDAMLTADERETA